jgi:hypothetical protein
MNTTGMRAPPEVALDSLPVLVLPLVPDAMVLCLDRLHATAAAPSGTVIVAASQRSAARRFIGIPS